MMLKIKSVKTSLLSISGLNLEPGEIAFVYGKSGSGKSLLLRAIADLDPNEGEIFLNNKERSTLDPSQWRSKVSLLPAKPQWWGEHIGDSFHTSPQSLQELDLRSDILEQKPATISSGENQRLALLRLLSIAPEVLLLDEPTANLDPDSERLVEAHILNYIKKNHAAIWVTHDQEQIQRLQEPLSDSLFEMVKGELVAKD